MKLRIISGEFGGRYIDAPKGRSTRPTASRVREAWFSAIGDAVYDATVVDLFAGSGALGIEALSRGARHVHFVESQAQAVQTLRENVRALGLGDRSTIVRRDALRYIAEVSEPFDVALADPPYGTGAAAALLAAYRAVPFAGALWLEHRSPAESAGADWTRRYGDTRVSAYRAQMPRSESE